MSQRASSRKKSLRVAFCGILAGLGTALMMMGGLFPLATYCAPLAASLLLIPVLVEYGRGTAWMVWGITALLTLLLGADKEAAFTYLFIGWYPALKPVMDRIRPQLLRLLAKLGLFMACIGGMYAILCFVLHLDAVAAEFAASAPVLNIAFFVMFAASLLLFDRLLVAVAVMYVKKLRPRLKLG